MRLRRGNPFSKLIVLCLVLLLSIGILNVGYALWSQTLYMQGTITTGQWRTCETGYAYGGGYAHCFSEYGFSNWGWSNGPLSAGSYTFDIYAGAGGCEPADGTLVGWLTVDYDENGAEAIVTYNMDAGFTMTATHLYVGNEPLPRKNGDYTTAPGQYPDKHGNLNDVTTDSYTVTGLSGEIYVVAHAVVCGLFD